MHKMNHDFFPLIFRNLAIKPKSYSFHYYLFLSLFIHGVLLFYYHKDQLNNNKTLPTEYSVNNEAEMKTRTRIHLVSDRKNSFHSNTKSLQTSKNRMQNTSEHQQNESVTDKTNSNLDAGVNSLMSKYLSEVRSIIVKNKFKNKIASRLQLKGPVELGFIIEKPNVIKNIQVLKSSGHLPLDQSALQTLQNVENFPNIPESLELSSVAINFIVDYQ